VAKMARLVAPHRRPVVFAMIGSRTDIADTFQCGANFVLYKPLALEQVTRSLRAGRGFMRPDRRRSSRQKLETLAYLGFPGFSPMPVILLDVTAEGLAIQAAEPLPPAPEVPVRFILPGSSDLVECLGEIIWADDSGRAGVLFSDLPVASRRALKAWLNKRGAPKVAARASARPQKSRVPALALD